MVKRICTLLLVLAAPYAMAQDYVPGEILVKMKGRPSGSKSALFMGQMQGKLALKSTFGKLNMHHMSLKAGEDMQKVLGELRENPDVEYAEPNYILRKADGEQAGADNRRYSAEEAASVSAQSGSSGTYRQSYAATKTTESWAQMNSGSEDVVVAVVDTGVDYTHSVFTSTSAIWTNPGETPNNGIDDDGNGYIDDVRGWNFYAGNKNPMDDDEHGTHVAGIIVGAGQDIMSGPFQYSHIKIMPLKFLGADGSGSTSNAISAIYYAVNNHAQVINNSWGGGSYSQALHDALAYAYAQGVVLVAAAGNAHSNNDSSAMYPANYPVPSQISVAATNDWDTLASFSNYGISTVHMAAPGVGIYSTVPGNYYRYMSGTSMAAPFVSGLAALAIREAPHLSAYQIRNLVINSSNQVAGLATKMSSGSRANSLNTIVNAKNNVNTQALDQPSYVASAPAGYRSPDSIEAKGGCGLVSTAVMRQSFGNGAGPQGPSPLGAIAALTLLPVLAWQVIRMRALANPKNRRRFERFVMNSEIKVRVGDRELVGQMNTISMGGVSFKADALLERGGVVTLQIASPDGQEQVQVEGRIVWSEQNQAYGVQFGETKDTVLDSIKGWTKDLAKAS
ncbi:MAG: S8 family serine peptidase [Bdellovibrionaceae bacterium]|nr:S8 family serine peptidase [Pseudobdellovibrionaceae bacterium]